MKEYKLYGYLNFLKTESGFVTPIFENKGNYYSQVEQDNRVKSFVRLGAVYKNVITKLELQPITSRPGAACIYTYYHLTSIYRGTSSELVNIFKQSRPDNKIILSFLNRFQADARTQIDSKRKHERNRVSQALSPKELVKLQELRKLSTIRANFYSTLLNIVFKPSSLNKLKTPEIKQFIIENKELSIDFNYKIFPITNNSNESAKSISAFKRKGFKNAYRKMHRMTYTTPALYVFPTIIKDLSSFIKKWLDYENRAQAIFQEALTSDLRFPFKIELTIKMHAKALLNSYEKLQVIIYQPLNMPI